MEPVKDNQVSSCSINVCMPGVNFTGGKGVSGSNFG